MSEDLVMIPPLFPLSDHIAALDNIERQKRKERFRGNDTYVLARTEVSKSSGKDMCP